MSKAVRRCSLDMYVKQGNRTPCVIIIIITRQKFLVSSTSKVLHELYLVKDGREMFVVVAIDAL